MKTNFKLNIKTLIIVSIMGVFSFSTLAQTSKTSLKNTSSSGGVKKHSIGVGIGQTFLMGGFSDDGDNSITLDALYNYKASHSFDLLITSHFSKHELRGKNVKLFGTTASIKSKVFDFDSFSPYFLGGLGFYMPRTKRASEGDSSEGKLTFGYNFGAGTDLKLNSKYTVGMLGLYHRPFKVKQDAQGDVSGSYFKLLLTLLYAF